MFNRQIVCLLVSVFLILGICFPVTAGNTAIQTLMVSVQVLDRRSAYMTAVRSTSAIASVNTYARFKESEIITDYSIDHSLTIERGKNITITGKIENPLPNGDSLFIRSSALAVSPDDIPLSTNEQDLIVAPIKGAEGSISDTYPFHYSLSTAAGVLEEIQQTRPIIVVLTVYY